MASDDTEDDRIGYGRPPKATRDKPGQSGNPAGRRKAETSHKAALERDGRTFADVAEEAHVALPAGGEAARQHG